MHIANSDKPVSFYSLDVIISIGYRVKSQQGTQFRIWANKVLKDHLLKGYTLNEKRLQQQRESLREIQQTLLQFQQSVEQESLTLQEAKGMLSLITEYAKSFTLLNQFDTNEVDTIGLGEDVVYELDYDESLAAIAELKQRLMEQKEASDLFGRIRDDGFRGILGSVAQTFGGQYLYPTIEEQAAHLLYFVIKNHPFSDGNKRIGAFLFVWFLEKNRHRLKKNGVLKINENALVALALLVAQSDPASKELMIQLIMNLIKND
ncbi:virulence protein RhuM/Fic/DOC family protein [Tellurirhabdus rosea]|uniref:virulence protein RhuM/Fic/DOC family protein n=1 Tax=Tellurirhabdus rosea TaxID=2674997 RepID=UPI002256F4AF|nr:virulence protein RhuM/Fic/DOC family protein [Tellurirhabdus rosea]